MTQKGGGKMLKILMKKIPLVTIAAIIAGLLLSPGDSQAAATDWPSRAVEVIVPYRAGGDTDFYARTYTKYLNKELAASMIVINIPGADGVVGCQQAASSRPDGYRVLFMNAGAMFTNKLADISEIDHNAYDVAAIGILDNTNVLVANKQAGFTDAKDFLEKVKAAPGKYGVAATMPGFSYFTVCKLQSVGNFTLNAVDYGGSSAIVAAIVGNQVPLAVGNYGLFKQYIEKGDIIPLMAASENHNPNFPDVPTVGDIGLPGAEVERTYFFGFPKGTDPLIIKKLSDAVGAIQKSPEFAAEIKAAYSVEPFYRDFATAKQYLDNTWNDMTKYKNLMKK